MNIRLTKMSRTLIGAVGVALIVFFGSFINAYAETLPEGIGIYNFVPPYQYRNMFETERLEFSGIRVTVNGEPLLEPIEFRVYNTTTQELETTVTSEGGELPTLSLIKEHNYMLQPLDKKYKAKPKYVWVHEGRILDIKAGVIMGTNAQGQSIVTGYDYSDKVMTEIPMEKRKYEVTDPLDDSRVTMNVNVVYGEGPMSNVKFKLISDVETIEATANNGKLRAYLLEEEAYTVIVDSDKYTACVFPIVAKDKSEYDGGRYTYDHSSCKMVETIQLVDKERDHYCDTTIMSLDGKVTAMGFNFKDLLLWDTSEDSVAEAMYPANADIHRVRVVNPHRWEFSRLHCDTIGLEFKAQEGRTVTGVHMIDKTGDVQDIDYVVEGDTVRVKPGRIATDTYVIEYAPEEGTEDPGNPGNPDNPENPDKPVPGSKVTVKKTVISSLKKGKRSFTVVAAKRTGVTGYQLRYSTKSTMKSAKILTIGKTRYANKRTVKKLKAKKKYYVQVRSYKTVAGKKYYSAWSAKKSVTTR